ncbi:PHP domain-containing protein [Frigoribacterium faeni]|uniref:PHP domain-containing protein n=1 Tax=Frigoribacterium faeni TaxID=145483 RepID=UPI001FABF004|nr:PHP domain-containing protein [Frigoribacterium faeni]MCJ0701698.1 PHP domain-containing protein [Frigoribacterium faeni]
MRFTHLRVASSFSAHYGTAHPKTLVETVAGRRADAAAITDRDGLYGAIRHIGACRAAGVDPIVGVELGCRDDRAGAGAGGGAGAPGAGAGGRAGAAGAGAGGGAAGLSLIHI